jgi:hypothetical protein
MMCFFFSLIPATVCVVVGYFVLFSATMTQGLVQIFGYILAAWLFVIAASFPAMGAYVTFAALCPAQAMIQSMQPKP